MHANAQLLNTTCQSCKKQKTESILCKKWKFEKFFFNGDDNTAIHDSSFPNDTWEFNKDGTLLERYFYNDTLREENATWILKKDLTGINIHYSIL